MLSCHGQTKKFLTDLHKYNIIYFQNNNNNNIFPTGYCQIILRTQNVKIKKSFCRYACSKQLFSIQKL